MDESKGESKTFKHLFTTQAAEYAKFRPTYPRELFDYLATLAPARKLAWDCATGNGQAAVELASRFERVVATDPSEKQLTSAAPRPNVEYRAGSAEESGLPASSFDLITVAQAFHWFDQPRFFAEAKRVARPQGVLAFWSYELARITPEVDAVVLALYNGTLGGYWESNRKLVEEGYRNVKTPFAELAPPPFAMRADWSFEHLIGYLGTWSALNTYIKKHGTNPLEALAPELEKAWGKAPTRTVSWPLALRVCRLG